MSGVGGRSQGVELERHEAIAIVLDVALADSNPLVVCTNGYISREAFHHRDREENFYMTGSMGLASTVGLGLALSRPERQVIVLDGDGALLMGLGHLAMVAERAPANFVHVLLDNQSYASTGGQRAISDRVPLDQLAAAAGYARVSRARDADTLREIVAVSLQAAGPSFVHARVAAGNLRDAPRVVHTPTEIRRRFRDAATAPPAPRGEKPASRRPELTPAGARET